MSRIGTRERPSRRNVLKVIDAPPDQLAQLGRRLLCANQGGRILQGDLAVLAPSLGSAAISKAAAKYGDGEYRRQSRRNFRPAFNAGRYK
jgi:hypothetical protein